MRTSCRPMVGNSPSSHGEDVLEQDREEEDRDRDPEQRDDQAPVIDGGPVSLGGDEPQRNAERDGEDHRGHRELESRRETPPDLLGDRTTGGDARAEIALREVLEVPPVLLPDRPVEAVRALDLLDRLRGRALAEQRLCRPSRQRPDPEEEQDREPEQDRDEQDQSADDEGKHQAVVIRRLSAIELLLGASSASPSETDEKDSPPTPTGLGTNPSTLLLNVSAAVACTYGTPGMFLMISRFACS